MKTHTIKFSLIALICCLLYATPLIAQTGGLSGIITDNETGETLPGANIFIQELSRGAATDLEGYYEIKSIPVGTYQVRVSLIGYVPQTVEITVESSEVDLNISLKADILGLEEVIVTGYTTVKKREITGSIASVSAKEIAKIPQQNAAGLLQGRAAGVTVSATSGTPGAGFSVQIRGQGAITTGAAQQPLYVIDGVQLSFTNLAGNQDTSPLNAINPDDIESIEVLKDAAATSIYGAQAANGVVLITTKSGTRSQKPELTFRAVRGASSFIRNIDYWNRDQAIEYNLAAIAYDNPNASPEAVENFYRNGIMATTFGVAPDTPFNELPDTDWFDFGTRVGVNEEYRLSIAGGDQNSTYRVSAGLEDVEGFMKGNDYRNINISGRFTNKLSEKFDTDFNIRMSNQSFEGPCQDGFFINCPISAATFWQPMARPFLDDGSFSPFGFPFGGPTVNPALVLSEQTRTTSVFQVLPSLALRYQLTPKITLRTQASVDYRTSDEVNYSSPLRNPNDNGSLNQQEAKVTNSQLNATLNYADTFNEIHNVNALFGFEYRRDFTEQITATGIGFPNAFLTVLDATAEPTAVGGFNSEFRLAGYFTSLKYNYKEKYFATFSARYDGSSRFGSETKFGFFPSVSAGWTISEEDFFNVDIVNDLKLRASYGTSGNQAGIGNFQSLQLFGTSGSYAGATALSPTQLGNDLLSWETSTTTNIGLDLSMYDGRVGFNVDAYRRVNSDLLLGDPLPANSSFTSITRNIGEVQNQGIELMITTLNINSRNFQWNTSFNLAYNENRILSLNDGIEALNPGALNPFQVGHSTRAINAIEYAGVNPADGRPMWYDANGDLTYTPVQEQDARFINGGDQDWTGGLRNTLSFKGLTLQTFFQFSFGQNALPEGTVVFGMNQVGGNGTNGVVERLTEAWRQPGDISRFPAPTRSFAYPGTIGYFVDTDEKFYNASYIRLKDITLSYSLPSKLSEKINTKNVNFFVTGLNLLTWTTYPGFDPEVAGTFTRASIPVGRVINGGIEVQF